MSAKSVQVLNSVMRGIICNLEAGLGVKFQFNPASVTYTKDVNYEVTNVPGWDHPDITYSSGGPMRITFNLTFDRTQGAVDSGYGAFIVPLVGTDSVKAALLSFLYPKRSPLPLVSSKKLFEPPPKAMLILGTNFFEGYLEGGQAINDILFDKFLTPVRMTVPISFLVVEEGKTWSIVEGKRQTLAIANSALAIADVVTEIF
jgi:hypothetical protein